MDEPSRTGPHPEGILEVRHLGLVAYEKAHALQRHLVEQRLAGEVGDLLLLCEHEPVVTVGRGSDPAELAATGFPVVSVERGGEATFHGPGQVVAYPILALPEERRDLHRYLRDLEEVVIRLLTDFGITGSRRPGQTGVWIGEQKVCSVGVAVRRWVTWHGLALNVHTDMDAFSSFRPCGLDPAVMTRVVDHAAIPPGNILSEVMLVKHFCDIFELELPPPPLPGFEEPGEEGPFPGLPLFPS